MSTAVVICNGDFPSKPFPLALLRQADVIVCCDGAAGSFMRRREKVFGFPRDPEAIVGDMDSISGGLKKKFSDLIVYVDEQDDNDQTKAFRHVLENYPDVDTVHILAASGKREDHTLGNLGQLMEYARKFHASGTPAEGEVYVDLVTDWTTCFAVTDTCELFVGEGRRVSIFSPDNSLNIKSSGLEWQTDAVVFDNWWKATLNRATDDMIRLEFSHPSVLLVILD